MKVHLLFFGRLRETLQTAEETLVLTTETATIGDVLDILRARGGAWEQQLATGKAIGFAINRQFAKIASPLADNDECAIFPPITGG
ncbi:MAG: MoaD/ThiS family protein [Gammaproteobacteria bacterium WSBS_2016_MAG_OTU1]